MALVMGTLAAKQRAMMALQGAELMTEIQKFDKVPSVGNMLMFSMHHDKPGVGRRLLQNVVTLVEYCEVYKMAHKQFEAIFHLFILRTFQKDT